MKNFKRILFIFFISFLVQSCQINSPTDVSSVVNSITYFQDKKTGLCFASINSNSYAAQQVVSITNVPCDKVSQHLKY